MAPSRLSTPRCAVRVLVLGCAISRTIPARAIGFVDDFSSNPFPIWSIATGPGPGFGDNSNGQITHDAAAGELRVFYDSSQPTVRIQRPLGAILTPDDAFKFTAALRFDSIVAPPCDFMQVNVALTNSATTGAVRAGPMVESANTFDNIELAYYPNTSPFGGPWVTLTVQGSPQGAAYAFVHFNFVSSETALPVGETLVWRGAYTPADRLVRFRCTGSVELALSIDTTNGGMLPPYTFDVDTFAITSYFDGADQDPGSISLLADTAYTSVSFVLSGNVDQDDDIDLHDFAAAQNCFLDSAPSPPECDPLDFDDDGRVNLDDHASFAIVIGGPQP